MAHPTIPRSRLSLFAVVMLFIVGAFTFAFVSYLVGFLIVLLAIALYLLLGWLTTNFNRALDQTEP